MICLSEEHRKLAEDNHNLIYGFLHRYYLDIEEWYDAIAIGYCKGIVTYNHNESVSLSTYLYKCMWNEYLMTRRRDNAVRRKSDNTSFSLDNNVQNESESTNHEIIADSYNLEEDLIEKVYFDQWKSSLKEKELLVLHYTSLGYTQSEIGKLMNYTQSYINRILKKLRASYKKEH